MLFVVEQEKGLSFIILLKIKTKHLNIQYVVAINGLGMILLSLETLYIPLHIWRGRHVTCRGCRVGGKPLWCLCHDPYTETEIKSARVATLTHTNMMPSVSLAALQTTYPLSSLTLQSSAISFDFGEMQCSGPREKVCACLGRGLFFPNFALSIFPLISKLLQSFERSVTLNVSPSSIYRHLLTIRLWWFKISEASLKWLWPLLHSTDWHLTLAWTC